MARNWSLRSRRNLSKVHPDLRAVAEMALMNGPHDFIVTEGLRTVQRQRRLVAQGKSRTQNSRHLTGHAIDIAVIGPDGVTWEWRYYRETAKAFKAAAKQLGVAIVWGGDWKKLRDGVHYELERREYPVS